MLIFLPLVSQLRHIFLLLFPILVNTSFLPWEGSILCISLNRVSLLGWMLLIADVDTGITIKTHLSIIIFHFCQYFLLPWEGSVVCISLNRVPLIRWMLLIADVDFPPPGITIKKHLSIIIFHLVNTSFCHEKAV